VKKKPQLNSAFYAGQSNCSYATSRKCELILEFLKSERIILRPMHIKDARDIFSYRSDPEIYQFQTWQPKTIADIEEFIKTRIVGEPNLSDTWFQLVICKNDSYELIGDCGLHFLKNEPSQVEIGITLKREHQGLGYATEALELVFKYVFGDLNKHRIVASVDPNNQASIRLLERMKMRKEAHFVENIWINDRWMDDIVYAILAREWKAI
jgi:RimJ/RimL family protein N-acetyltransferase